MYCVKLFLVRNNNKSFIDTRLTSSRYHHVIHRRRCKVQPPPFGVAPITAKRDVIRKIGSTQRSATPPEDDRATATQHTEFRSVQRFQRYTRGQTDRRTDRRVDHNISHPYRGGVIKHSYTSDSAPVSPRPPYGPLSPNVTLSIKPEVHNVAQRRRKRTEPRPQAICIQNSVRIGPAVPEICSRTDRHTDRQTDRNTPNPSTNTV